MISLNSNTLLDRIKSTGNSIMDTGSRIKNYLFPTKKDHNISDAKHTAKLSRLDTEK
jgi:hypothetical protein